MDKITDKIEEEKKLKDLLGNDLIEDSPGADEKTYPLTLPRIKKDIHDTIDNDKIDKKPIISENGESKCKIFSLIILSNSYTYIFSFSHKCRKEKRKQARQKGRTHHFPNN